ncbi:MAG: hypothetical protein MZV64_09630 [Ignavibacteriales bacterium]|nr:hypothetical protein [Ignavibacteriales bacterium]
MTDKATTGRVTTGTGGATRGASRSGSRNLPRLRCCQGRHPCRGLDP